MKLDKVYVSSHRRGFFMVEFEAIHDGCPGHGTFPGLALVTRVVYSEGSWDKAGTHEYWTHRSWVAHLALTGGEPWRWYELEAANVVTALEAGGHIDDIRGFKNRYEPWQPYQFMYINDKGQKTSLTCPPSEADYWEREDGWRVVKISSEIGWEALGEWCNADRSVLKNSPNHFDPIDDIASTAGSAMLMVDENRPWE